MGFCSVDRLEYTDSISFRGVRPKEVSWVWCSTTSGGKAPVVEFWGVLSTLSLPLLSGSLWPRVVVPVGVPSMHQIDQFKDYLYSIGPYAKNPLKKQLHKKCK